MNRNRKYKSVVISSNMIDILRNHYMILADKLRQADAYAEDPDEEPTVKPLEYAFICGQIAELEGLLKYAGAITEDELFQSALLKRQEED